jgi:hypothetical protein
MAISTVEEIRDAVILKKTPAPKGLRVEYQPKHTEDGFVRQGAPLAITVQTPGETQAGSYPCENCPTLLHPTFYAS